MCSILTACSFPYSALSFKPLLFSILWRGGGQRTFGQTTLQEIQTTSLSFEKFMIDWDNYSQNFFLKMIESPKHFTQNYLSFLETSTTMFHTVVLMKFEISCFPPLKFVWSLELYKYQDLIFNLSRFPPFKSTVLALLILLPVWPFKCKHSFSLWYSWEITSWLKN